MPVAACRVRAHLWSTTTAAAVWWEVVCPHVGEGGSLVTGS